MDTVFIILAGCSIPLAGIFIGFMSMRMKHEERKIELMAQSGQEIGNDLRQEIANLRQEMLRLRDTSTQYDLSLQHTLEETQHRLATLESKARPATTAARADETPLQKNGLG